MGSTKSVLGGVGLALVLVSGLFLRHLGHLLEGGQLRRPSHVGSYGMDYQRVERNFDKIFMTLQKGVLRDDISSVKDKSVVSFLQEISVTEDRTLATYINQTHHWARLIMKLQTSFQDNDGGEDIEEELEDGVEKEKIKATSNGEVKSGTIIYNRINKSGSASLLSKFAMGLNSLFQLSKYPASPAEWSGSL